MSDEHPRSDEPDAEDQARAIDEAMDEAPLDDDPFETLVDTNLLRAAPGLARIAGSAWWRVTGWAVGTSWRASTRVVRSAANGESPAELFQATGAELREYARRALEIVEAADPGLLHHDDEPTERTAGGTEPAATVAGEGSTPSETASTESLRERGAELLRRSADVRFAEDAHPAYDRILGELAPDEGRILRLLALEGPQPAVDVRSGWLPQVASQLVAPGLSMIGSEAGCRHKDRVPAYLNNLNRLGLIWFSREPVKDRLRYQVVEAQPEVIEAMNDGGRRTIRRSIQLTPFGDDFCETCLPLHTAELDALPGPDEDPSASNGKGDGDGDAAASVQQAGRPKPTPDQ